MRLGAWSPVWVEVQAPQSGLDGTVQVETTGPAGKPGTGYAAPVRAAPGARVRVFVPAVFYDARAPGTVQVEDRRGRVASMPLPRLRAVEEIVVVLAAEPLGLEALGPQAGGLEVAYVFPEALPPVWQAYQAVRLLAVRDLDDRRLDDDQRRAVHRWVWSGGRLLAAPSGDDVRHLEGPTLGPLIAQAVGGRVGRGRITVWEHDAALPRLRGQPAQTRAWEEVLAGERPEAAPKLEATLAPGRGLPARAQVGIGILILAYLLVARRLSRSLARPRPATILGAALLLAAAIWAAGPIAAAARQAASGVIASMVLEGLPGTGHALLTAAARPEAAGSGDAVRTARVILLRPVAPAQVRVVHGDETIVEGPSAGVPLTGSAVVPLPISGRFTVGPQGAAVEVMNRSGHRLDPAWVFAAGRVQAVPGIGGRAQAILGDDLWQPPARLRRTEPHHALLQWAFSRLESDDILKSAPAWLVGWIRDPALSFRWNGRSEPPLQLVLVPLTGP